MRSISWDPASAAGASNPDQDPAALAACLAVCLLMAFPAAAGAILVLLALAGIATAVRAGTLSTDERRFAWLSLTIPAAYLLNMALTGWAMNLLDRPMHLAYGVLLALLLSRRGLGLRSFAIATMVAATVAGAIALFEGLLAGQARVFGLGGRWNAVPYGNFSLLMGCAALAGGLALNRITGARGWLAAGVLAFAAGSYASMMSGSRGGWLALPVLLIVATHASRTIRPRHRLALAGLLLIAAAAAFSLSDAVRGRIAEGVANVGAFIQQPHARASMDNASGIRLAMWRWGVRRFEEHPLTGIGYANFADYRTRAIEGGELPPHFGELANLHNEVISSLAFGGLPSGVALLAFWVLATRFFGRHLRHASDPEIRFFACVGLLTVVGTGLFSMTEGLFGTRAGTYGLALMLALPAGALCHRLRRRPAEPSA